MVRNLIAEAKRLIPYSIGFFSSLLILGLLSLFFLCLAKGLLPASLGVRPFQIGIYMEGEEPITKYLQDYVTQMESTKGILEFQIRSQQPTTMEMQKEHLAACIVIRKNTAEAIMNGQNIPIEVHFPKQVRNTQWYLQCKLIQSFTQSGAVYIDVPQTETILLYQIMAGDSRETLQQMEQLLDLFHLQMVMERDTWFVSKELKTVGSYDFTEYYTASLLVFLLLLWGMGLGHFICDHTMQRKILLERKGYSLLWQFFCQRVLYCSPYLIYIVVCCITLSTVSGRALSLIEIYSICLMVVAVALQTALFFQISGKASAGILGLLLWNVTGFIGAGGILPDVFLPEKVWELSGLFLPGICMKNMLALVSQSRSQIADISGKMLIWVIILIVTGVSYEWYQAWRIKKQ